MAVRLDDVESARASMRRGIIEVCLLAILSHGEGYTGDLVNVLKEKGILVIEGTVYPVLSRLRKQGYLQYRWEESTQGPPRKYFYLSDSGRDYYNQLREIWTNFSSVVEDLHLGQWTGNNP